ncbi:MAG: hypothetical protein O8C64_05230 [Candidatus Methanoperedens sp.]|nr:hypothetical protein [Candidatus Methanoperedens sp.]MCZ7403309.1 hypothetical protein [Candidatus Methanoperedens sp.]
MAYKIREKRVGIRAEWEKRSLDFETEMSIEEIRSLGGSKARGQGAKWIDENLYQSVGGYLSKGGMPFKLRTKNGDVPISPTDVTELTKSNIIKPCRIF